MWVVLMQHRLQNGYYRAVASLVSDVNLMHNNAVEYNGATSDVVIKSNFVCEKLLLIVENIFPGTVKIEKNTHEDEKTTMKENCRPSSMEVDSENDEEYVYSGSDKEGEEEESDEEEEEEDGGVGQQQPNNKRRRVRKEEEE